MLTPLPAWQWQPQWRNASRAVHLFIPFLYAGTRLRTKAKRSQQHMWYVAQVRSGREVATLALCKKRLSV